MEQYGQRPHIQPMRRDVFNAFIMVVTFFCSLLVPWLNRNRYNGMSRFAFGANKRTMKFDGIVFSHA